MLNPMWWGYLHQNGTIQVKRWFGDHKDYTEDCEGNEFVIEVVRPFTATSDEEAYNIIAKELEARGYKKIKVKICSACGAEKPNAPCQECAKKKHRKLWKRVSRACAVGAQIKQSVKSA